MPDRRRPFSPLCSVARLALALTLCAALGALAPNTASGASAPVASPLMKPLVNPDGTLDLSSGFNGALDLHGWQVTLDPRRGPILTQPSGGLPSAAAGSTAAQGSAPQAPPQPPPFWLGLPNTGLGNVFDGVNALAVSGNDIYVGGTFHQTGDGTLKNLGGLARFNTNTNTWSALPNHGLNGSVLALAIMGGDLYVGGNFTHSGDGTVTDLNYIARFSHGAWSALPKQGLNSNVNALAVSGDTLYAGGQFCYTVSFVGQVVSCGVIKFSGGAWSALPNKGVGGGAIQPVYALAVSGTDLYVGGLFSLSGDYLVTNLNNIARLSGGTWLPLPHNGLNGAVDAIVVVGGSLYVGGDQSYGFSQTFDGAVTNLNRIARLSGGVWSALPGNGVSNFGPGLPSVKAFAVNGSDLYVGGFYNQTGDGAVSGLGHIGHFNTISNTWTAPPNMGFNGGGVAALAFHGNDLFVGGNMDATNDNAVTHLGNLAKLTNDTDGDSIPDEWERSGVTINGVHIDLPAMGANPLHKDLFIHADWMNQAGLKPDPRDLQIVTDAFENAPLANPDGISGVRLHVDLGADSVMNPATGATWGALAKAGPLPYAATIGSTAGGDYSWAALDTIKQTYFNPAQRAAIFHYMCFCSKLGGLGATSGVSRGIPGHDFLVTLGGWSTFGGTSLQKAGTFMHELGHNLGLQHGGGDDTNYKPNYLSVMNYSFQIAGLLTPSGNAVLRSFDYSRSQLPALDETALLESAGISDAAGHLTVWNMKQPNVYCEANPDSSFDHLAYPATDWNCDGAHNVGPVTADINGDGLCVGPGPNGILDTAPSGDDLIVDHGVLTATSSGSIAAGLNRKCETTAAGDDRQLQALNFQQPDQLAGFDDWSAVRFDGGGQVGHLSAAAAALQLLAPSDVLTTTVDEATYQQIATFLPPALFNAEASAPIDVVTVAPASGSAPLRVHFDGSASTTLTGTVTAWAWDFGDSTVGSGAAITHTYALPGTYFATLRVTNSHGAINLVALEHRVTVSAPVKLFLPFVGRE